MSDNGEKNNEPKRPRQSDDLFTDAGDAFQPSWNLPQTAPELLTEGGNVDPSSILDPPMYFGIGSAVGSLDPPEFDRAFILSPPQAFITNSPPPLLFHDEGGQVNLEDATFEFPLPTSLTSISSHDMSTVPDINFTDEHITLSDQGTLCKDGARMFPESTTLGVGNLQLPSCVDDLNLTSEHHRGTLQTEFQGIHFADPASISLWENLRSLPDVDFVETYDADNAGGDQFFDASADEDPAEDDLFEDCLSDAFDMNPTGENESSQEGTPDDQNSGDQPLYKGAKVTVSECSVAFLSLMLGCNISGQLLSTFLSFILLILPEGNRFFSSLHLFLNQFKSLKAPLNFTYYCSSCLRSLLTRDSICPRCTNGKVAYYLNLPVIPQIQALYSNSKFIEALSYRFNRSKLDPNNLEDIYDGELYKSADHILSLPYNTSLMWNTDGISIFKSSNFQIWPFYFIINELPPHLRYREEYMLLAGLAFGDEKPSCNIFLKPISDECEIMKDGYEVSLPNAESPISVKTIVLCGTCDALAKSLFLRLNNFNGFHGCPRCLAKGQKSDVSEKVFVYPHQENFVNRTIDNYYEHLLAVRDNGGKEPVFGVKGPTYLLKIVWTFFLSSTAVDVMHNVYLGVCRQLFFLWFSTAFLKKVFGDSAERKQLTETLSAILVNMKAPHYFARPPRSLKNAKYFKAAEFRVWLFSTALPLLAKHMKEPFLGHFKKLVCGVSLLNQASVSRMDVETARGLLNDFVRDFQTLYSVRNMSFNVHCLLHLADNVLLLGPLFVSSCFGFESLNGRLARLVHGTRHAGLQIYSHLGLLRNLSPLVESLTSTSVKNFCHSTIYKTQHLKVSSQLGPGISIIGNIVKQHVLPPDFSNFLCHVSDINANLSFFFRLRKHGFLYVSEDYGRGTRLVSSTKLMMSLGMGC